MPATFNNKIEIRLKDLFLFLFFVFLATIHLYPGAGSNGNVEQWINITNHTFHGNQDFLFSYGPLFWITGGTTTQYSAASYWLATIFLSGMYAVFWATTLSLALETRTILLLSVAFLLFIGSLTFFPALFLWPFILVVYLEQRPTVKLDQKLYLLLGLFIALAAYIRFYWGMVALATLGSYFFSRALADRKFLGLAWLLAGLVVSYVVIGLIVFHNTESLLNYLLINNQLSFGNSVDMTLDVNNRNGTWVAVTLIFIALNIYVLLRKKYVLLTLNVLLLLFLKVGFSRTDHYIDHFVPPVAVLLLLPLLDKSHFGRVTFLIVAASLYYLNVVPSYPGAPDRKPLRPVVNFNVDYDSRMQAAYQEYKLSPELLSLIGNSSIDVYPYNNEYAFANKLNYQHRPVFQNYMTLTPKLDSLNQAFYESAGRPRFVLWTTGIMCTSLQCNPFASFDGKYSLNEDPLTTSAILMNYHPVRAGTGKNGFPLVLLEKNDSVSKYSETLVASQEKLEFGKWYEVPRGGEGLYKVKPEFNFTLYGRAKNMLFRGSILKVKFKLPSGDIKEYRANILNSASGILVSPLLDSFEFAGIGPTHIMFEASSQRYFEPSFSAQWVRIPAAGLKVK